MWKKKNHHNRCLSCPSCRACLNSTCRVRSTVYLEWFDDRDIFSLFELSIGPIRQSQLFLEIWPVLEMLSSFRRMSRDPIRRIHFVNWPFYRLLGLRCQLNHRNQTSLIPILTWCKCVVDRPVAHRIRIYYLKRSTDRKGIKESITIVV